MSIPRRITQMKNAIIIATASVCAALAVAANQDDAPKPAKISASDIEGAIFARPDMTQTKYDDGNTTYDVTTMLSSDNKFGSGMYRSGKTRIEISDGYPVDEFMYFVDGSVTLTSSDGTVQVINAGEAVTIPMGWSGIWETEGYTKFWVIYSKDGSGLQ